MRTALTLAALGAALAWPVPALLARARWTWRAPRAGLLLWQAVGLAAGLAGIGAGLALAVAPLGPALFPGLGALAGQALAGRPLAGLGPLNLAGLVWAVALTLHLAAAPALSALRVLRARARHRRLVELLARPHPIAADARVVDHPAAVAYCLPGLRPRVVLSAGTLRLLTEPQLAALLAHERAHARARHDLVLLPFLGLTSAFPRVPPVRHAREAVATLVEMHADDRACREHEPRLLAAALLRVGAAAAPAGALAAAGHPVLARVQRLLNPRPAPAWLQAAAYLAAASLLALPTLLLAAPVL